MGRHGTHLHCSCDRQLFRVQVPFPQLFLQHLDGSVCTGLSPSPPRVPPSVPAEGSPPLPWKPHLHRRILTCSPAPAMISRGSSTFPRDLLIFRPCLSRTMEWRSTWGQGGAGRGGSESLSLEDPLGSRVL